MKVRTLIADDEPLARERLRQLLADEPEIELLGECADGRETVAAIQAKSPDLIFLDIQMPELDGFAVLEAITTEPMPLLCLSPRMISSLFGRLTCMRWITCSSLSIASGLSRLCAALSSKSNIVKTPRGLKRKPPC